MTMPKTQTGEPHEVYAEAYEAAHAEAMGALFGTMMATAEGPPMLTEALHRALRKSTAAAFGIGVKVGRKHADG
jgi:hypothetical protein